MIDPTQQPTQQVPAAPPTPPFPQSRIDVVEQGIVFTVAFTPTLQLSQFVDDATMTAIDKRRLELKKQQKQSLDVIHAVHKSKIN